MFIAKVTSKGQVTIPKEVRERLGISTGEEIEFYEEDGVFYIKKRVRKSPFDKWVGYLRTRHIKDTDEIIEDIRGR